MWLANCIARLSEFGPHPFLQIKTGMYLTSNNSSKVRCYEVPCECICRQYSTWSMAYFPLLCKVSSIIWQRVPIIYIIEFHLNFFLGIEGWTTMCFFFSTLLASTTDISSTLISVLGQLIWSSFQPTRACNSIIFTASASAPCCYLV